MMMTTSTIEIRHGRLEDADQLFALHQAAVRDPEGLIRQPEEITAEHIGDFLEKSIQHGLIFVAVTTTTTAQEKIVGEIHAHTPPLVAFRHLLTDLAIAVHPEIQGQGLGRRLFEKFLQNVPSSIARVELYTRETNIRNVQFYQRVGFVNEGPQRGKICMPNGELQTPLHMAWFNPNFEVRVVQQSGQDFEGDRK